MTYTVEKSNQAERFLSHPEKQDFSRIETEVELLASNPFPRNSKKLKGLDGVYSIRIGTWRIIYTVDTVSKTVLVYRIEDRKNAYKLL